MESIKSTQYIYDSNNRLIREVTNGSVTNYTYDSRGNILTKGSNSFSYGSSYLDRLEKINGVSVSYDSTNPYKILGFGTSTSGLSFIYTGKDITSIKNKLTNVTTSFTYDSFGRRTSKGNTSYVYLDGKLEAEITSSYTLRFLYDENDNLFGFYYNDTPYFYLKNALGTIYGIVDQNKNKVVEYSYDAWGKLLSTTSSNTTISNINPFIYKSYYYDKETGLYWLSSRYYNPDWGRFISPDSIDYLEIESINGLNLFAYCGNDPVNMWDPSGHFVISTFLFIGSIVVGALIGGGTAAFSSIKKGDEWYETILKTLSGAALGGMFGAVMCTGAAIAARGTICSLSLGASVAVGASVTIGGSVILGAGNSFVKQVIDNDWNINKVDWNRIASDGFVAGIKGFLNFGVGALTGGAGLWDIPKGTAPGLLNLATKMFLNTVIGGVLRLSVDAIYATILGEECTWIKGIKSIMDWVF